MIEIIVSFILGAVFGWLGSKRHYPKFIVRKNESGDQVIESVPFNIKLSDKAEFLEEWDQEKIEEMERPSKMRRFLNKFVKPKKQ